MSRETKPIIKPFNFSGEHLDAMLVERASAYHIQGRTIVINPTIEEVYVGESPRKPIPPFSSTILLDTTIERATSLLLFQIKEENNLEKIILESGWQRYGDILGKAAEEGNGHGLSFPLDTPLWRSLQDDAGVMTFEPSSILNPAPLFQEPQSFQLKVNLWFAPQQTHCFIHNRHDFIEIHTQLCGYGSMQKFRTQRFQTLYEEQLMSPGYTPPVPFCHVTPDGTFEYPWHQYYAETACLWLAIEYHPLPLSTHEKLS